MYETHKYTLSCCLKVAIVTTFHNLDVMFDKFQVG
jgi:hypothetical protein